eukprot:4233547-Pyramimonas_sp.AAC.1
MLRLVIGAGRGCSRVDPPGGSESCDADETDQSEQHEEEVDTFDPRSDFMQRTARDKSSASIL